MPVKIQACAPDMYSHSMMTDAYCWTDNLRLCDIEGQFICQRCGKRGADMRPEFPTAPMGRDAPR